jgi:hypothetical protein
MGRRFRRPQNTDVDDPIQAFLMDFNGVTGTGHHLNFNQPTFLNLTWQFVSCYSPNGRIFIRKYFKTRAENVWYWSPGVQLYSYLRKCVVLESCLEVLLPIVNLKINPLWTNTGL